MNSVSRALRPALSYRNMDREHGPGQTSGSSTRASLAATYGSAEILESAHESDAIVFQVTMNVAASVAEAWRIVSDVMSWSWWLPTVSRVHAVNDNPLRVGAQFKIWQPKLLPATWTVSEISNCHFVWQTGFPGLRVRAEHVVCAQSMHSCRLELRLGYSGVLRRWGARRYRPLVRDYLQCEARMLAELAEWYTQSERGEQLVRALI